MSARGVPKATSGSYPIGAGEAAQPESSRSGEVQFEGGASVPRRSDQVERDSNRGTTVLWTEPTTEERQWPPRSLSREGWINSSEYPGGSPTVGHGNPRP